MKTVNWLLILLTLLNVGLLLFNYSTSSGKKITKSSKFSSSRKASLSDVKENYYFKSILDENRLTDIKPNKGNGPQFVMRFSHKNCDLCIKNCFFEVQHFMKQSNKWSYRIVGSFSYESDLDEYKRVWETSLDIENVPESYFGLQLEQEISTPFFFVLFPDGSARHVFIPMKEDVQRTRTYLSIIYQKYFKDES